ncbi:methyltransferase domain-containing protein [Streptomyces sp. NPDC006856]|uniref:methyltransferase domain-containing protein n=1 Tax=Streptomyces sp. NPDC006856 TaxID=3364766 RepID=UPI00368DAD5C
MTTRAFRAIDRFHDVHPWDHNAHHHPWIMRQLPRRFGRALDVGSGSGDLARLLATRATEVRALDADRAIVARARELTGPAVPVTFTAGDALTETPPGPYDVITCVATLHHLPFTEALDLFRRHLAPGGTLVVETARQLLDHVGGTLVVPQTVLVEAYWQEIHDGLTRAGVPVHHVLLHTGRDTLVERIETDTQPENAGARQWRLDHLTDYERALPWLRREAQVVDTTGVVPAEVAETVLRGVRTGR